MGNAKRNKLFHRAQVYIAQTYTFGIPGGLDILGSYTDNLNMRKDACINGLLLPCLTGILPINALNVASNLWLLPLVFTLDGNDANCKRQTFAGKNKSLYARSV